jgi:60 kDa SS-A/Ro ribonucleoprotein
VGSRRLYAQGKGDKGALTWKSVPKIIDALDAAFYATFQNVEPCGKPVLLALDASGSMGGGSVTGSCLTPREASVAMALVTAGTEEELALVHRRFKHCDIVLWLCARCEPRRPNSAR